MAIDARIALGVQPMQLENPMNALAKVMQLKGMQQEQGLNALKMDEYQRGTDETQRLNALYSTALGPDGKLDRTKLLSGAATGGLGSKIPGLQKGFLEEDKGMADLEHKKADTIKSQLEAAHKRVDLAGQALGWVRQNPTLQNAQQAVKYLVDQGIMPQDKGQEALAKFQSDPTPQGISAFAELGYRTALSVKDQLPKFETRNTGGTTDTLKIDPVTGQTAVANTVQNTQSPDNKASVGASYANAAATREVASATRDAAKIQTGFQNEQGLRKEFEGLPEVKNYKQAYPAYAAIKDAATRSTPQSDINMVYGIAKLYDPNSVVREGEYATVANSPAIPERIKGYAQYLAGGGKLSSETKKQILAEAQSRIQSYQAEHDKARTSFDGIARRRGIDPANVFQATGDAPMGGQSSAPTGQSLLDQADAILRGGK